MSDPFDQKKKSILSEIEITSSDKPDASPKGTIDELCLPIIKLINSHQDMFTTSSCSGRVSVFVEGSKIKKQQHTEETTGFNENNNNNNNTNSNTPEEDFKIGAKGDGGHWLFVTHNDNQLDNWWRDKEIIFDNSSSPSPHHDHDLSTRYVLFKFEPLILHVKTRNFESASKLYTTAMNCGFRESGIGVNNIVAIRISIRLDIPIAYLEPTDGSIVSLVSEDYLSLITKLGYDRFQENKKKLNQLFKEIETHIINAKEVSKKESKEERRLRKMQEGMARRDEVRQLKDKKKKQKELEEQLKATEINE